MMIHRQFFYEKYTGQEHEVLIVMPYLRRCYEVRVDNEFYSDHDSKIQAFDEVVDIIKANNWSPLMPI